MKKLFPALLAVFATLTMSAQASLLYYEGFDYTGGSGLVGQTGGTGWSAAWNNTSPVDSGISPVINATGLTYTGLATTGGSISDTSNTSSYSAVRLGTAPFSGTSSVWISFLINVAANPDNYARMTINPNGNATSNGASIGIGWNNSMGVGGGGYPWSSSAGGVTTPDTTTLILARLDSSAPYTGGYAFTMSKISVWVNPTLGGSAPLDGSAAVSYTWGGGTGFQGDASIAFSTPADWQGSIDEIRYGTTFADVTPAAIPEPATWALLAGALGAGILLRRRRA